MPGVLIEGGPRGLYEERACRLRPTVGASLRGSACGPSERIAASAMEDMVECAAGMQEYVARIVRVYVDVTFERPSTAKMR